MTLSVGQKAQRSLLLTEDHVRLYAQITGDRNPLHFDPAFAAEVEVRSVHPTKPVSQLGVRVWRNDGETVLEGEAWCYRFE